MSSVSFLDLPGELRNNIYHQLLVINPARITMLRNISGSRICPQILYTCRKIHHEAKQVLYSFNIFIAHTNLLTSLPSLRFWYGSISRPDQIAMIRRFNIRVRLDCDPNYTADKATKAFTGIDELTIEVWQAQWGSSDYTHLRLFEGVRGVKGVKIYGSISAFPDYANWLQNSIMAPEGTVVPEFVPGEKYDVRSYDIWTVSRDLKCVGSS